jgi:hypothetical protein
MNPRRLAAALAATAALAAPAACSSSASTQLSTPPPASTAATTPTSTTGGTTISVGQTAEFPSQFAGEQGTTMRLTVTAVTYATSLPQPYGASPTAPTRGVFAKVTMTATNVGSNPGVFDSSNFQWVSPSGQVIPHVDITNLNSNAIPTVTLQPGQHSTGVAVYDVSAKGGQLEYVIYTGQSPLVTVNLPPS